MNCAWVLGQSVVHRSSVNDSSHDSLKSSCSVFLGGIQLLNDRRAAALSWSGDASPPAENFCRETNDTVDKL